MRAPLSAGDSIEPFLINDAALVGIGRPSNLVLLPDEAALFRRDALSSLLWLIQAYFRGLIALLRRNRPPVRVRRPTRRLK